MKNLTVPQQLVINSLRQGQKVSRKTNEENCVLGDEKRPIKYITIKKLLALRLIRFRFVSKTDIVYELAKGHQN